MENPNITGSMPIEEYERLKNIEKLFSENPLIITDPKGEILSFVNELEKRGYNVHSLKMD